MNKRKPIIRSSKFVNEAKHALVFDGTSYYVTSNDEATQMLSDDEIEQIVKTGDDLDKLDIEAIKLNQEVNEEFTGINAEKIKPIEYHIERIGDEVDVAKLATYINNNWLSITGLETKPEEKDWPAEVYALAKHFDIDPNSAEFAEQWLFVNESLLGRRFRIARNSKYGFGTKNHQFVNEAKSKLSLTSSMIKEISDFVKNAVAGRNRLSDLIKKKKTVDEIANFIANHMKLENYDYRTAVVDALNKFKPGFVNEALETSQFNSYIRDNFDSLEQAKKSYIENPDKFIAVMQNVIGINPELSDEIKTDLDAMFEPITINESENLKVGDTVTIPVTNESEESDEIKTGTIIATTVNESTGEENAIIRVDETNELIELPLSELNEQSTNRLSFPDGISTDVFNKIKGIDKNATLDNDVVFLSQDLTIGEFSKIDKILKSAKVTYINENLGYVSEARMKHSAFMFRGKNLVINTLMPNEVKNISALVRKHYPQYADKIHDKYITGSYYQSFEIADISKNEAKSILRTINDNRDKQSAEFVLEAKITSDKQFTEYANNLLKEMHGDKFDQAIADKTISDLLSKYKNDYGAMIGALRS